MSRRPVESFEVVCDFPGCDTRLEHGDYSIFGPSWDVEDLVTDAEWRASRDGTHHFCSSHPMTWASDHEAGEPWPTPPFLLIHDGDTDHPVDDDGKVTLVRPWPELGLTANLPAP